jgi:dolichol-phosphate mannosyltransferase
MNDKTLIFIPTYNERENAPRICEEIFALGLDADVLFIDDNSPDGTGEAIEALKPKYPRLSVRHRSGKLGIGSAHAEAIAWAYEKGYCRLVTLDCDFTHSPADIPKMIAAVKSYGVAVGSRFIKAESLPGWSLLRRLMTLIGHLLTRHLLGISQDASGAFRVYDLGKIAPQIFKLVTTKGYGFFFDSLHLLKCNKIKINEISIILPSRTYGNSKMSLIEVWKGLYHLFKVATLARIDPDRFRVNKQHLKSPTT